MNGLGRLLLLGRAKQQSQSGKFRAVEADRRTSQASQGGSQNTAAKCRQHTQILLKKAAEAALTGEDDAAG